MAEEEEKKPLLNIRGTYVGKEFIKSGDKDGKEWKMYKLMIKVNETDNYPKKITAFSGLKGLDEVEEGDFVNVGYVEGEPYQAHGKEQIPKTALFIGKSDKEANQTPISGKKAEESCKDEKKIVPAEIQKFVGKYISAASDTDRNINHFCGCFFRTFYKDKAKEIEDAYKDNFDKPKPAVEEEIVM